MNVIKDPYFEDIGRGKFQPDPLATPIKWPISSKAVAVIAIAAAVIISLLRTTAT